MNSFIPIAYKSKSFPQSATMALCIDTETWKIGFEHFEDFISRSINTEIQFLCFSLRWRKFIEDIQRQKGVKND